MTLKKEDYPGLCQWDQCNHINIKSRGGRQKSQRDEAEKAVKMYSNVTKTQPIAAAFEDVGRGLWAKELGWSLEAKTDPWMTATRKCSVLHSMILNPANSVNKCESGFLLQASKEKPRLANILIWAFSGQSRGINWTHPDFWSIELCDNTFMLFSSC